MSKQSVSINITGGTSAIGSVNQGDHATICGTAAVTPEAVDRQFGIAQRTIYDLAQKFEKDKEQVQAVLAQLSALRDELQNGAKNVNKASDIIKVVRENFSWAYPAIKDFAKAIWPTLLAIIGI